MPTMWNRVPGESFMNPYDISQLRDFNIFAMIVTLLGSILNRASLIGNDTSGAGRTPHEQKMANVLGTWRNGFTYTAMMLLAIITVTFMVNPRFAGPNKFGISSSRFRYELSAKVLEQVIPDDSARFAAVANVRQTLERSAADNRTQLYSQQNNPDTPCLSAVRETLKDTPEGRYQFQQYNTLYHQMMMPMLIGKIFPTGLLGLFCLLMIMLLISTDDSRIFNASSTLMQDVLLPFWKSRLSQKTHLLLLRLLTVGVAAFFFIVALFFAQLDYINMFTTIMCSLWLGGAGPIMVFGLYSRFGNLTGAWCAIIFGSGTSLLGLILQRTWAQTVYPFLENMGWIENTDIFLRTISAPFTPWIEWSIDPVKFPINSFEIYFISMIFAIGSYIVGSLLTYKPYDLDKLLHRGIYADAPVVIREPWNFHNFFARLVDITSEYTKGDKLIAYSLFCYSFIYGVLICFGVVVVWNVFAPWSQEQWGGYFLITGLIIPCIIGLISTVWFMIGGVIDLKNFLPGPRTSGGEPG